MCTKLDGDRGLPDGAPDWTCHEQSIGSKRYLTCARIGWGSTPPGWTCRRVAGSIEVCNRPLGPSDRPDGSGWSCESSSSRGRVCVHQDHDSGTCTPGELRWCETPQYSTWGIAACRANGTWPTTVVGGRRVLACADTTQRPANVCACFNFYFNPMCCERSDCIIPASGPAPSQPICPKPTGQACDPCNPRKPQPQCNACVTNNAGESYCAPSCDATGSCPTGQSCVAAKIDGKPTDVCVPATYACYSGL